MTTVRGRRLLPLVVLGLVAGLGCRRVAVEAEDKAPARAAAPSWPMLGGTPGRNLVSPGEKGLPLDFRLPKDKDVKGKNIRWSQRLGSLAYGATVIAGGKIFVGTNNEEPRDPKIEGDRGVLMCFRQSDGQFLWQAVHEKLGFGDAVDCKGIGICSSPAVDGNRLYYVSNRCELVCADVEGEQTDGKPTGKAKTIWSLDMIKELGVMPNQATSTSPLVLDDLVYTLTCQGTDHTNNKVANPEAPSFIAVNKTTGKVVWKDNSPGKNIMEGQWTNCCAAQVDGTWQVIVPNGDGWLRAFEAKTGKLLWKFDCNPKKSVYHPGGKGDRNYIVGTPVVHENRLYVGVGREPEAGPGVGHLWCVDITKKPANKELDLSPVNDNFDPKAAVNKDSGLVWHYGGPVVPAPPEGEREIVYGRTLSTVAVHDGLVYAAEMDGYLHCLDAATGKKYWVYDCKDASWNSPYCVDSKVLFGVNAGDLYVFETGKQLKPPKKIDMLNELKVPPVVLGGVMYATNGTHLFAIGGK